MRAGGVIGTGEQTTREQSAMGTSISCRSELRADDDVPGGAVAEQGGWQVPAEPASGSTSGWRAGPAVQFTGWPGRLAPAQAAHHAAAGCLGPGYLPAPFPGRVAVAVLCRWGHARIMPRPVSVIAPVRPLRANNSLHLKFQFVALQGVAS